MNTKQNCGQNIYSYRGMDGEVYYTLNEFPGCELQLADVNDGDIAYHSIRNDKLRWYPKNINCDFLIEVKFNINNAGELDYTKELVSTKYKKAYVSDYDVYSDVKSMKDAYGEDYKYFLRDFVCVDVRLIDVN